MNENTARLDEYLQNVFLWDVKNETESFKFYVRPEEVNEVIKYINRHNYNSQWVLDPHGSLIAIRVSR